MDGGDVSRGKGRGTCDKSYYEFNVGREQEERAIPGARWGEWKGGEGVWMVDEQPSRRFKQRTESELGWPSLLKRLCGNM